MSRAPHYTKNLKVVACAMAMYAYSRDSMNSRNVDYGRAESDLSVNLKKAISPEETAPKRKHVRSKS